MILLKNKKIEEKWWQKNSNIPQELNDVPIMENNSKSVKNSEFVELHNAIDNLVYEFMKTHSLPKAYSLKYEIDTLQSLRNNGVNTPDCDRFLQILDDKLKPIITSM